MKKILLLILLLILCLVAAWGSYMLVINRIEQIVAREIGNARTELYQEKQKFKSLVGEIESYQALYQTAINDITAKVKLLDKVEIISQGMPLLMQVETGAESITKQQLPELAKPDGCSGKRGLNKQRIDFKTKFMEPPKVLSTISSVDFAKGVDHRINTKVTNVTKVGFSLDLITWCDTRISKVEASWIAVGY
ncbi:H-type lectin domain-containing protein [Paraglaciecola sp. MB-3u-78]|uniref:H-type lectin domain-containing protein n=1 Tax=Paraglaciecola sp. MB-3u-78 TaxID=2058332 RepID=UPI000C33E692|nr:H-type lectin domain-containing protein [Paraglaciecola sp. MB-3u-78]PKG93006.1 hypothetical protein CXF95_29040 [Paraglaciecola sp. MB-3u-78]